MSYSAQAARDLAAQALGFIAADPDLAETFLASSALRAEDLRALAAEPDFALHLLDFICEQDARVLDFAQFAGIPPTDVMAMRIALAGPGSHGWDLD